MAQEAPARTKIPTKSPQPAHGGAARSSAGRAKAGRTVRGRVLASGTGRAATRGGGPVIELECGITVYPTLTTGQGPPPAHSPIYFRASPQQDHQPPGETCQLE